MTTSTIPEPPVEVSPEHTSIIWDNYIKPASVISIWYLFNITTVLLNKYLFKVMHFNYPFTLTCIHMTISYLGAIVALKQFKIVPLVNVKSEIYRNRVVPLSLLFCGSIILGNFSLNYISVAFMQTVKSSVPAFSVLLAVLFMGETFSTKIYVSIFFVVAGVALSTLTELEFNMIGFICAVLASVANALQALLTGVLLSGENRLDSFNLLYNMAPLSALFILPLAAIFETIGWGGRPSWIYDWEYSATFNGMVILFASGMIAFGLNYVTLLVVKHTSALTSNVAGNFKVVLSIIFSVVLFGTQITYVNALGCVAALVGVAMYNYYRLQDSLEKQVEKKAST